MTKSGHKGISRIDSVQKKMFGWYVRVQFANHTRAKFVSDRAHGGREAALAKAVEWRNQLEQELGKPRTDYVMVGGSGRGTTGVVGVQRRLKKYVGKGGKVYWSEVFEVSWQAGRERMGKTSVSIRKYGEAGAFKRACAIRREKERQMYGQEVVGKWAANLARVCAA